MKYKITNKTGMRLRYAKIKFEAKESKVLDLDLNSVYEHEYFTVEKLEKKSLKSLNRKTQLEGGKKQNGISRRME